MPEYYLTCRVCRKPKPPGHCPECKRATDRRYKIKNREKLLARYRLNAKKESARARQWQARNAEREKQRKTRWEKENAARCAAKVAAREALKLQATPDWLTKDQHVKIAAFYAEARRRTQETGIPHAVDHIHPLRGKTVCGLHVPWNLQILTQAENIAKSNRLLGFV